ncbi:MAG: hypothetical protein ACOCP8_03570, partial [archaeon]
MSKIIVKKALKNSIFVIEDMLNDSWDVEEYNNILMKFIMTKNNKTVKYVPLFISVEQIRAMMEAIKEKRFRELYKLDEKVKLSDGYIIAQAVVFGGGKPLSIENNKAVCSNLESRIFNLDMIAIVGEKNNKHYIKDYKFRLKAIVRNGSKNKNGLIAPKG